MMRRRLCVTGIVQGVGFRPYVWHLAHELNLHGWVRNHASGVEILVQGNAADIDIFTRRLPTETPPLSRVRSLDWSDGPADGILTDFRIEQSVTDQSSTMIGHDAAVCPDCLAEMFDATDRRRRYAFINCTHCGPRYTLTHKLPYDRAQTSMAKFRLCRACEAEYSSPGDRRFHAEPTSCPACGPRLWLAEMDGRETACADPVAEAVQRLQSGQILGIKGLGGFHLACDARNPETVRRLRERKQRDEKPFALMFANAASISQWVELNTAEKTLLQSAERPIVVLRKKPDAEDGFPGIAPGLAWLGVMLPYTPLQWLLFHHAAGQPCDTGWLEQPQPLVLVMTSANPGGEPLVLDNDEAIGRLSGIADAVLMHDRNIVVRCDDSVVRMGATGAPQFIRRARGYTPRAIRLPRRGPSVLALGGHLKNTVCVTRGDEAFVSQHIGSLDNPATCRMLREVTDHLLDILQVRPDMVAHDLHPDYHSSRYAREIAHALDIPAIGVQHHHAHIASVAAEHGITGPVLGLAMDGVGIGSDGAAWGGELLRVDEHGFTRLGHLAPLPLPGGDKAAREPWRMAAAVLHRLGRGGEIASRFSGRPAAARLHQLLERNINSYPSSSLGRWFDAAAGLLGVCDVMAYEGRAAMLLEGLAEGYGAVAPMTDGYRLHDDGRLDLLPLLAGLSAEPNAAFGAALFHATLAGALADWADNGAGRENLDTIILGGGCFLNRVLSRDLTRRLAERGLTVLAAGQVPPNDGGLSLGQAWVGLQIIHTKGVPLCV